LNLIIFRFSFKRFKYFKYLILLNLNLIKGGINNVSTILLTIQDDKIVIDDGP
jgi:hypothetical protein